MKKSLIITLGKKCLIIFSLFFNQFLEKEHLFAPFFCSQEIKNLFPSEEGYDIILVSVNLNNR